MSETPEEQELNPDGLEAYTILGTFLQEDGWYPQELPNGYAYRMGYEGNNGNLRIIAHLRVEAEQLLIYAFAPVSVPEEHRAAISEFTTRANYGMFLGNFELNFEDGELRYKCSISFKDISLDSALIRNHIYPAARLMDRYLPGVLKVIYGGKSAEEAVKEIESAGG